MTTKIKIQNLKCGGCASTIIKKLSEIEGITNVEVKVEDSLVIFNTVTKENITLVKEKLATIGYPEIGEKNSIVSKAKSFVSCATGKIA